MTTWASEVGGGWLLGWTSMLSLGVRAVLDAGQLRVCPTLR